MLDFYLLAGHHEPVYVQLYPVKLILHFPFYVILAFLLILLVLLSL